MRNYLNFWTLSLRRCACSRRNRVSHFNFKAILKNSSIISAARWHPKMSSYSSLLSPWATYWSRVWNEEELRFAPCIFNFFRDLNLINRSPNAPKVSADIEESTRLMVLMFGMCWLRLVKRLMNGGPWKSLHRMKDTITSSLLKIVSDSTSF